MTPAPEALIRKYCQGNEPLAETLLSHSRDVAHKALRCLAAHPELECDATFVRVAAMLHDIGIVRCHAPSIHCFGTEPYIAHGPLGATILRNEGLPEAYARVAERHTGTGLPGLEPQTTAEQLICYADKFFSKTRLGQEKTLDEALRSLARFGEGGVDTLRRWHALFREQ